MPIFVPKIALYVSKYKLFYFSYSSSFDIFTKYYSYFDVDE